MLIQDVHVRLKLLGAHRKVFCSGDRLGEVSYDIKELELPRDIALYSLSSEELNIKIYLFLSCF